MNNIIEPNPLTELIMEQLRNYGYKPELGGAGYIIHCTPYPNSRLLISTLDGIQAIFYFGGLNPIIGERNDLNNPNLNLTDTIAELNRSFVIGHDQLINL